MQCQQMLDGQEKGDRGAWMVWEGVQGYVYIYIYIDI